MFKNYSFLNNKIVDYKYADFKPYNMIIENFIPESENNNDIKFFDTESGEGEFKFEGINARYIKLVVLEWNEHITGKVDVFVDDEIQNTPENSRNYSSVYNNDALGTGYAQSKLDTDEGWRSAIDNVGEWIEIDLGEIKKVNGIKILKKKDSTKYINKFVIHYSSDNEKYSYIKLEPESNARKYKFLFNGCPTNVDKIEKLGEDEETFNTCALKCNSRSNCHHFEITGCTGNDHNPSCKGTCHIFGEGIPTNGDCDVSGQMKSYSKVKSELTNNNIINVNEYLVSPNGRYFLVLKETGNLVLYNEFNFISENIIWKSTENKAPGNYYCIMQEDGKLIIYKKNEIGLENEIIWNTEINEEEEPEEEAKEEESEEEAKEEKSEEAKEESEEGMPLKYNTPFSIEVKSYPDNKIIKSIKLLKYDDLQSTNTVNYNDKVHIVKVDNPYEIAYFPDIGDGNRKLSFINTINSDDNITNHSFYIKPKLDSDGEQKFKNGDNVKFNHEISISNQDEGLTDNCGWWGCRVLSSSGFFSHGGKEIESVPVFKINKKRKENIYVFKVQDDSNLVLYEKIGVGVNKLWESRTNYEFSFNGKPTNLTAIENESDNNIDTYKTCIKKCSDESSCSAFMIEGCDGNDNYPICSGKCILYSGYSNPENENDDNNKNQKTYKKITAVSQIGSMALDAATETVTTTIKDTKKQFNKITNIFGNSEDDKEDSEDDKDNSENVSMEDNTLIMIILKIKSRMIIKNQMMIKNQMILDQDLQIILFG